MIRKLQDLYDKIKRRLTEEIHQKAYWLRKWEVTWKNTLVTAAILTAATAVCAAYHFISDGTLNIIMFYTIALIFIPRFTEGYVPGIAAAMSSVLLTNYFFTEPYYEMDLSST
ncbi:MAG: DUF4118 domain-containing protein, partial [Eisenbergiella sp.]